MTSEQLVRLWGRWLEAAVVFWCPWVLLLEQPAMPFPEFGFGFSITETGRVKTSTPLFVEIDYDELELQAAKALWAETVDEADERMTEQEKERCTG